MLYSCAWNLGDSIGTRSTEKIPLFHGLKYKKLQSSKITPYAKNSPTLIFNSSYEQI
jgi:hypothetical protein